jgi:hypothetical protein
MEVRFWGLAGLFGCATERGTTPQATACRTIDLDSTAGRRWVQLAVFAAALGLLIATMSRNVRPYDEGLILFGSARVQSGDIPYRDFYANYGPGQFYALATLFKVFGPSVLVERLWDLLIRAYTVLVVYLIVDSTWNRRRALSISLLVTIWLSYFEFHGYPVFPCLLFALLSLYCLIPIYRRCRATAPLLALSIVPSLIILGVCRLHLHSRGEKILSGIGVLCLLSTSLPPIQHALARPLHLIWRTEDATSSNGAVGFVSSTPAVRPEESGCFPPTGLERIRCFTIPEEQAEAIHYIQQHTAENEGILVGSNRHDKIFVNDVLFYFASKRSSVTKWHQFDPGVQTTQEVQSEIVAELQTARPRYIVLNSRWDNMNEPNESARSSGVKTPGQRGSRPRSLQGTRMHFGTSAPGLTRRPLND